MSIFCRFCLAFTCTSSYCVKLTAERDTRLAAEAAEKAAKPWSVCLWESHPDNGNDDCSTGADFATEAEARACVENLDATFDAVYYRSTPYVELDGPTANEVTIRPDALRLQRREAKSDDREWQRERAMQAGMGLGVEAYNDEMGWGQ